MICVRGWLIKKPKITPSTVTHRMKNTPFMSQKQHNPLAIQPLNDWPLNLRCTIVKSVCKCQVCSYSMIVSTAHITRSSNFSSHYQLTTFSPFCHKSRLQVRLPLLSIFRCYQCIDDVTELGRQPLTSSDSCLAIDRCYASQKSSFTKPKYL